MSVIAKVKRAVVKMAMSEVEKHALAQAREQERFLESPAFMAEVAETKIALDSRLTPIETEIVNSFEREQLELIYD